MKEVADHLNAIVLYGDDRLESQVFRYSIAAMQLQNYLTKITENCMVITPGDRGEVILGALEAHLSKLLALYLLPDYNRNLPFFDCLMGCHMSFLYFL